MMTVLGFQKWWLAAFLREAWPIQASLLCHDLEANVAAGTIALDATAMAALDAAQSRSTDVPLG